jgi:guanosine-3',5'-bis(diphosphate) 3'-pyrophosphohydrolase
VAIHRRDCPNIVSSPEPERLIDVDWGHARGRTYPVTVMVIGRDRPGMMRDVLAVISDFGINLGGANVTTNKRDGTAQISASLEVQSNEQLLRILNKIERVQDVQRARRHSE